MPRKIAKTNKTAPVLRLLTRSDDHSFTNPIIDEEFKQEVIHVRSGGKSNDENSSRKDEASDSGNGAGINIVSELVAEWLPKTLARFKCCDCALCRAEMTVEALNKIPPKYVFVNGEKDFELVKKTKEEFKPSVLKTLVGLAIQSQRNPKHQKIS